MPPAKPLTAEDLKKIVGDAVVQVTEDMKAHIDEQIEEKMTELRAHTGIHSSIPRFTSFFVQCIKVSATF